MTECLIRSNVDRWLKNGVEINTAQVHNSVRVIEYFLHEGCRDHPPCSDAFSPNSESWHRTNCWMTCKHNTSNDMFSRCKSVQNMATGKSDDQIIQPDNKLIIGTKSENSELAMIAW